MNEVFEFDAYAPKEIAEKIETIGVTKARLPVLSIRGWPPKRLPIFSQILRSSSHRVHWRWETILVANYVSPGMTSADGYVAVGVQGFATFTESSHSILMPKPVTVRFVL